MTDSNTHSMQEQAETIRVALDYFEPGDRYADQHEYVVNAHAALSSIEEQLEVVRELYELRFQSWSSSEEDLWTKALGTNPASCPECGLDLHGYQGPRCRYCDGVAV